MRFFIIFLIGGQTGAVGYFFFIGLSPFLKTHGILIDQTDVALTLLMSSVTCALYGLLGRLANPVQLFKAGVLALGCLFPLSVWLLIHGYIPTLLALLINGALLGCHGAF